MHAEHPDADPEFVAAICQLVELNASDLHLVVNDPPMLRVDGKLRPAKGLSVWNKDRTYEAIKVMTNELEMERFKDDLELDISFSIGDLLRFRVNVYRDRLGVCAALRTIPTEIKTTQELGLDRISRSGVAAAWTRARMRSDRLRQIHHARRDCRQSECRTRRPYHHH